jgi:hypothetical protein
LQDSSGALWVSIAVDLRLAEAEVVFADREDFRERKQ